MSRAVEGVLVLDKPAGPTSHDCVDAVRRGLGLRRVGHAGTLDPAASGVLVLAVGRATRLIEYVSGADKSYRGTVRLGVATDTLDGEGAVTEARAPETWPAADDLRAAAAGLTGEIQQVPPAYSAVKRRGVPAHRLARRGREVQLDPRPVSVHAFEVGDVRPGVMEVSGGGAPAVADCDVEVRCSSGTYVRCLARDLGAAVGLPAHLAALRRTAVGPFTLDEALVPPGGDGAGAAGALGGLDRATLEAALLPPGQAVRHLPRAEVGRDHARNLLDGLRPEAPDVPAAPAVAVWTGDAFVGIAEARAGHLHPRKIFYDPGEAG